MVAMGSLVRPAALGSGVVARVSKRRDSGDSHLVSLGSSLSATWQMMFSMT